MRRRFVVLTEIIAPYRIPVFNALAQHPQIDLHVIFLADTDPTLRQWHVYAHEIEFSYEVLPSWRWRIGEYNVLLNRGLTSALKQAAPEAVLCGGYNYLTSWECLSWARRNDVRFLLWVESTARDSRNRRALVELLKKKYITHCDGFVVPGKSSRQYLLECGAAGMDIFVAPNAVDNHFFSAAAAARMQDLDLRAALQLPTRYFLFVGRLVPAKGVFDLLQAYGMLPPVFRKKIGLVFVGDGVAKSELGRLAASIWPGSVQFCGFVQRELLPAYYAFADALVLPTHSDTWGLVVNEAMACGLPIVVSDVAGCVADLVDDSWNGRVIHSADSSELAAALAEVAGSSDIRAAMGARSSERIRAYSPEACANGIATALFAEEAVAYG